ncbi:hypothetical protein LSTR_LSTR000256 [Laodelphax striatellus]|uniref:Uncharacterized protein n=1 Tax=Laodelphax striatellus TaxID=195883 RepID=A0A482X768_LAOST|nr:hypothetical protein LSTR_LSTR000256 [Laodelphax striatellus]
MMKSMIVFCFLLISAVLAAPPRQIKRSPGPKPQYSSEEFYGWGGHRPHYGHYEHHGPYGYHDHYHGHHDGIHHYGYGSHHGHNSGLNFGIGFNL